MRRNIFLAVVAVFLTVAAFTGCGMREKAILAELNAGNAALDTKDYETAAKHFKSAAEHGNAEAQFKLGDCYAIGNGVEASAAEAEKWYRKAAEQGHTEAQYQLGSWYDGRLVINNELCENENENEDVEEALKWYHKAAEQGHRDAKMRIKQHDLLAAEKGDAEAQYRVGCYYLEPHASDLRDMAVDYLRKASEQGHEKAKEKLKELERTYTAWEKARPQDGEKDDTIITERTELIEAGKYCRIVVSMGDTNLCIWSYLKARCRGYEDFQYIKTTIYDTKYQDFIFFENGKELFIYGDQYISRKDQYLEYNGKKYDIGSHLLETPDGTWCDVFVDDDKLGVGRYIRTFR